jgi:hypothetical protein
MWKTKIASENLPRSALRKIRTEVGRYKPRNQLTFISSSSHSISYSLWRNNVFNTFGAQTQDCQVLYTNQHSSKHKHKVNLAFNRLNFVLNCYISLSNPRFPNFSDRLLRRKFSEVWYWCTSGNEFRNLYLVFFFQASCYWLVYA